MRFSKKIHICRGIFILLVFFSVNALAIPHKILSTNLCVDFLLIHYVNQGILDSSRILALSPFLKRYAKDLKSDWPTHSGRVESILQLSPDLIISGIFDSQQTKTMLQTMGFPIYTLPLPENLAQISQIESDFLQKLGISTDFISPVESPQLKKNPKRLLMLGASLIATGKATFENSLIESAGFQNAVDFAGFQSISLERIIARPPDFLLLTTPANTPSFSTHILKHPILRNIPHIETHNDWRWQCAGPWTWELLENLKKVSD